MKVHQINRKDRDYRDDEDLIEEYLDSHEVAKHDRIKVSTRYSENSNVWRMTAGGYIFDHYGK